MDEDKTIPRGAVEVRGDDISDHSSELFIPPEGATPHVALAPTIAQPEVVLDNFQLLRKLGEGTYATAYLARQLGTDRHAVVKITHPHLLEGRMEDIVRKRFEVEVRASTRVKHANIITIYTIGDVNGAPAIAMEYAEGVTLESYLVARGALSERAFVTIFSQIAGALCALHAHGIIHRDLSPRNIVVHEIGADIQVKILDFGISQIDGGTCQTMGPVGTPQFMAPEILEGEMSEAVDVFSLGALMWWAATGKLFIPGGVSQAEIFKLLNQMSESPDLTAHATQLSPELEACIRRALAPDPGARPPAREIAALIDGDVRAASDELPRFVSVRALTEESVSTFAEDDAPRVLLLTQDEVPFEELAAKLDSKKAITRAMSLARWQREPGSFEDVDVILVPVRAEALDASRLPMLKLVAARMQASTPTTIFAYGDRILPRDELVKMGADEVWTIPRELSALCVALSATERVGSDSVSALPQVGTLEGASHSTLELVDELIEGMPSWLLEIEYALLDGDRARLFSICGEISSRAMGIGAESILALTREICALLPDAYASDGVSALTGLKNEYRALSRSYTSQA